MKEEPELLYEGRYLRLLQRGSWEYAERRHGGAAVIVIAVTPDGNLLFVEQYRPPIDARSIEMPAGLVGDTHCHDSMEDAARRELLEETGWEASEVKLLLQGPTSAGMSTEMIGFVRATGLRKVHAGGGVDNENITVHEVPVQDAPRWLTEKMREGYSMDLKLWAGLWLLDRDPDGAPV
jgi:ADP-ribose pyrophosphatase